MFCAPRAVFTEEQIQTAAREAEDFMRNLSDHGTLETDDAKVNQRITTDGEDCSR